MGFLKKLFGGFSTKPQKTYYVFQVRCKRCGEIVEGRVDVDNDLSVEYESGGDVFYVRKVLMGSGENHCYQQIEAGFKFNAQRKLLERRIESGGDFVEDGQ
jgi:lysyl-tRNA synthetase class I